MIGRTRPRLAWNQRGLTEITQVTDAPRSMSEIGNDSARTGTGLDRSFSQKRTTPMSNLEERDARRVREIARISRQIDHAEIRRQRILGELARVDRDLDRNRQLRERLEGRMACNIRQVA
jgi:hypothetical protein